MLVNRTVTFWLAVDGESVVVVPRVSDQASPPVPATGNAVVLEDREQAFASYLLCRYNRIGPPVK